MSKKNNKTQKKNTMTSTGSVSDNKRAGYEYEIVEKYECGIVLTGSEVKSLRMGRVSLSDAYAGPKDGGIALINLHIPEYPNAPRSYQHEPKRPRQLLLKKKEMDFLLGSMQRDGMTLVPLGMYFNARGLCKVTIGLGKGKNKADKRQTIKERDWNRQKSAVLKNFNH